MEEKKFTEKESLELISQMIQATRKNLVKGQGNYFIIYGYTAAILSIIIYTFKTLPCDPKEDSLLTETSEFLFYAIE